MAKHSGSVTHQILTTFADGSARTDNWHVQMGRPSGKALFALVEKYNRDHDTKIRSAELRHVDGRLVAGVRTAA